MQCWQSMHGQKKPRAAAFGDGNANLEPVQSILDELVIGSSAAQEQDEHHAETHRLQADASHPVLVDREGAEVVTDLHSTSQHELIDCTLIFSAPVPLSDKQHQQHHNNATLVSCITLACQTKGSREIPKTYQGDEGVEQGPLKGEQDGGAGRDDLDEGGLEQLVAVEGHIPEEPGQGASSKAVPVIVPQHLLLLEGNLQQSPESALDQNHSSCVPGFCQGPGQAIKGVTTALHVVGLAVHAKQAQIERDH